MSANALHGVLEDIAYGRAAPRVREALAVVPADLAAPLVDIEVVSLLPHVAVPHPPHSCSP